MSCGFENRDGDNFCAHCGTALQVLPDATAEAEAPCRECGGLIPAVSKFCGNCGIADPFGSDDIGDNDDDASSSLAERLRDRATSEPSTNGQPVEEDVTVPRSRIDEGARKVVAVPGGTAQPSVHGPKRPIGLAHDRMKKVQAEAQGSSGAAVAPAGAGPMAAAQGFPDLTEELAEIQFYVLQGLEEDAHKALEALRQRHPDHPDVQDFTLGVDGGDSKPEEPAKVDSKAPPVPAPAPGRSAAPSPASTTAAPSKPLAKPAVQKPVAPKPVASTSPLPTNKPKVPPPPGSPLKVSKAGVAKKPPVRVQPLPGRDGSPQRLGPDEDDDETTREHDSRAIRLGIVPDEPAAADASSATEFVGPGPSGGRNGGPNREADSSSPSDAKGTLPTEPHSVQPDPGGTQVASVPPSSSTEPSVPPSSSTEPSPSGAPSEVDVALSPGVPPRSGSTEPGASNGVASQDEAAALQESAGWGNAPPRGETVVGPAPEAPPEPDDDPQTDVPPPIKAQPDAADDPRTDVPPPIPEAGGTVVAPAPQPPEPPAPERAAEPSPAPVTSSAPPPPPPPSPPPPPAAAVEAKPGRSSRAATVATEGLHPAAPYEQEQRKSKRARSARKQRRTMLPGDPQRPDAPSPFGGEPPIGTTFVPGTAPPTGGFPKADKAAGSVRLVMLGSKGQPVADRVIEPSATLTVGRDPNEPWGDDEYLEQEHATFSVSPGTGLRVDDGNGRTLVFRQIEERWRVRDGDEFRIGQSLVVYRGEPEERVDVQPNSEGPMQQHPLGNGLLIGRDYGDIQLPDDTFISAEHCRISRESDGVVLTDLGSSNGTYVRVRTGDVVEYGALVLLGHTQFEVQPVHETDPGV